MTVVMIVDIYALEHRPKSEYAYAYDATTLHLLLRTKKDDVNQAFLIYGDPFLWEKNIDGKRVWRSQEVEMKKTYQTSRFDFYMVEVKPPFLRTKYAFLIDDGNQLYHMGPQGVIALDDHGHHDIPSYYNFPMILDEDLHHTPSWVESTIWYQIFPDRFFAKEPRSLLTWGKEPVFNHEHYGGNLKGITEKLPYLRDLGITGIYFTPLFTSPTAHKYDTTNYFEIDPQFGSNDDLKTLVDTAHQLGIRVMLDGVFNHAGFLHPYFQDVIKHGESSPYIHCFYIDKFPIITFPLSEEKRPMNYQGLPLHYKTFAFQPSMPKWNTSHPLVQKHLLDVVSYWIKEYDIDGWRLDVSNELSHDFLRAIKKTARSIKKDSFILGENWDQSLPWLQGDQLDSVMNYELSYAIWSYLEGQKDGTHFHDQLMNHLAHTPKNVIRNMFNLVGSHDTIRIKKRLQDDTKRVKCAYVLMFTSPGTPTIYYGDEIGMTGDHDPDNRRCMPWDPSSWDHDFYAFTKSIITIKKTYHDLFLQNPIFISREPVCFYKAIHDHKILCIVNGEHAQSLVIPQEHQGTYINLLSNEKILIHDTINLEAYDVYLYLKEVTDETNHS